MKPRNIKVITVLSTCLAFTIIALGFALTSCDIGAGRAPAFNITFHQGEGQGRTPDRIPVAPQDYARLPDQGAMTHPTGKKLSGWKAPDDSLIYNPLMEYRVTSDVMLTAQWRDTNAALSTVSFTTGGSGGVTPASIQTVPGNIISLPTQGDMSPPAGKVFDGWLVNGVYYQARAYYTVTSYNITITALWRDAGSAPGSGTPSTPSTPSVTSYTVTYNVNGGTGTAPSAQKVNAGSSITLPNGSGLSKSGATFGGWNTNNSGTGTNYPGGASYTVNGNATLYAKWDNSPITPSVTTYTVTFNTNGGSGTAPSAQKVNAGSSITLPSGSGLSKSDATFGGWNTNNSGTGTNYPGGASYTVNGNATLYAKWNAIVPTAYTVTYNLNGGTGTTPSSQTVNSGSSITLPSGSGLSKSGATFGGWNTNNSGTGTNYSGGASYTVNANATLYAKWVAIIPAKPTITSITYTERANRVIVIWNAVSWAVSYRIYYGSNRNLTQYHEYTPSPTSTSTAYRYTDNLSSTARIVPSGGYKTYYYCQVSAINSDGTEGPRSDIVNVSW